MSQEATQNVIDHHERIEFHSHRKRELGEYKQQGKKVYRW